MHQTFADKANPLGDTWSACITGCQTVCMHVSQVPEIFSVPESVSFNVLLSASNFGSIKEEAEIYLKSYLQEINRGETELVANLFKLYTNAYIFSREPLPEREEGAPD